MSPSPAEKVSSWTVIGGAPTTTTRPIRYSEVDGQGVVFNSHYLTFCADTASEFFVEIGVDYIELTASGYDIQVVNAEISWRASFRPGQVAKISVGCVGIGSTSFTLAFAMTEGARDVAVARVTYVCVRTDGSGRVEVPATLRGPLTGA